MSLRPSELKLVIGELADGLQGAFVQKIFVPLAQLCYLELRQGGEKFLLCLSVEPEVGRVSIARSRPASAPGAEAPFQRWLRQHLTRSRLDSITLLDDSVASFRFLQKKGTRTLIVDLSHRSGALLLLGQDDRILAVSADGGRPSRWTPGETYTFTRQGERRQTASSRLAPQVGSRFSLAEAAEALLSERQSERRAAEIRRRLEKPLRAKLARVARTREKVLAEASRGDAAEQHRRFGELISQNLHRLKRGDKTARLVEYSAAGPVEVDVPLQAERSPKEQVQWHFHQYRRLLRGSERASARLDELEQDRLDIQRAMEQIEAMPMEELLQQLDVQASPRKSAAPTARPYKEYWSRTGERIWVGRNAASNEELTFRVAQPHHLWLHARGTPGSHVLVPLDKGKEASQELLLDAAHLALHHSSLKSERRGEVGYTQAKYIRRLKGGRPGTVNVTRERTLLVVLEPERMQRLLKSRTTL